MTATRLLAWYDAHRRDLPWRRDRDPYRVWLSEVMLQQTRVEVAVPYFERFTARFPDVAALAAADLDEVLALWSGLGYYRRARQLHAAARQVARQVDSFGGFPRTVEGLRALPGIGPYTAAAVASIAFGVPAAVVDGNVERVAARLAALDADPKAAPARRRVAEIAADLLDPARPGDSNQALMELGATVCTPRRPRCALCPLRQAAPAAAGDPAWPGCRAALAGDAESYPPPRRRRAVERQRRLVALVEDAAGRLLLFRRADGAELLAGTWELPWVPWPQSGPADGRENGSAEAGQAAALARRYGGRWRLGGALATARHAITFRDLELVAHRAAVEPEPGAAAPVAAQAGWHRRPALARLPLSSMVGKVLAAVDAAEGGSAARGAAAPGAAVTPGTGRRR
jgi:A/G-specific adenine glycosylase